MLVDCAWRFLVKFVRGKMSGISKIRKRDGRIVDFDISKISEAILNAAKVCAIKILSTIL